MSSRFSKQQGLAFLQYCLPQHLLSRVVGWLASSEWQLIKAPFIRLFIWLYRIDMGEARYPIVKYYPSFNAFFIRRLKLDARPIAEGLVSPADGAISQLGKINDDRIFQAKGHDYSLTELLGGSHKRAAPFRNGQFATIYLSPSDYHRVHMPYGGVLREMIYVPGKLFSVNTNTARHIPGLFARNERVVCIFDTDKGPMALILVGAMIVAAIETVWAGKVAPARHRYMAVQDYRQIEPQIRLEAGDEVGHFKMGSTAIVLLPENRWEWQTYLAEGVRVKMGGQLADPVTPR